MRRVLAALGLLLLCVAATAHADEELLFGYPPALPTLFGGTGERTFTAGRCVETYDAGNSVIKFRASAASCVGGGMGTGVFVVKRGGVSILSMATELNFSTDFTVADAGGGVANIGISTIGDVTAVGDCTSGDCFTSGTSAGTELYFWKAPTGRLKLDLPTLSTNRTIHWPDNNGTVAIAATSPLALSASGVLSTTATGDITQIGDCSSGAAFTGSCGRELDFKDDTGGGVGILTSPETFTGNWEWLLPDRTGTVAVAAAAPLTLGTDGVIRLTTPTPGPTPADYAADIDAVGDCTSGNCFTGVDGRELIWTDGTYRVYVSAVNGFYPLTDHRQVYWPDADGVVAVACTPPLLCPDGTISLPSATQPFFGDLGTTDLVAGTGNAGVLDGGRLQWRDGSAHLRSTSPDFYVADYGTGTPVCDGVNGDDSIAAINAAVAAAAANPLTGGRVIYPPSGCLITKPINLTSKVKHIGAGQGATQISGPAATPAQCLAAGGTCSTVGTVYKCVGGTLNNNACGPAGFSLMQPDHTRTCTHVGTGAFNTGACDAAIGAAGRGDGCRCYNYNDCESNSCGGPKVCTGGTENASAVCAGYPGDTLAARGNNCSCIAASDCLGGGAACTAAQKECQTTAVDLATFVTSPTNDCSATPSTGTEGDGCLCTANADCASATCILAAVSTAVVVEGLNLSPRQDNTVALDFSGVEQSYAIRNQISPSVHSAGQIGILLGTSNDQIPAYWNRIEDNRLLSLATCIRLMSKAASETLFLNMLGNGCGVGILVDGPLNAASTTASQNVFLRNMISSATTIGIEDHGNGENIEDNYLEQATKACYSNQATTYSGSCSTTIHLNGRGDKCACTSDDDCQSNDCRLVDIWLDKDAARPRLAGNRVTSNLRPSVIHNESVRGISFEGPTVNTTRGMHLRPPAYDLSTLYAPCYAGETADCTDCAAGTYPCTGSSTGARAICVGDKWFCQPGPTPQPTYTPTPFPTRTATPTKTATPTPTPTVTSTP